MCKALHSIPSAAAKRKEGKREGNERGGKREEKNKLDEWFPDPL